jgi:hypothetical protein
MEQKPKKELAAGWVAVLHFLNAGIGSGVLTFIIVTLFGLGMTGLYVMGLDPDLFDYTSFLASTAGGFVVTLIGFGALWFMCHHSVNFLKKNFEMPDKGMLLSRSFALYVGVSVAFNIWDFISIDDISPWYVYGVEVLDFILFYVATKKFLAEA